MMASQSVVELHVEFPEGADFSHSCTELTISRKSLEGNVTLDAIIWEKCTVVSKEEVKQYQMKRTESPATSLLALTNTLQPVVRRCRLGCPAGKRRKNEQMIAYLVHIYQLHTVIHRSFHIQPGCILLSNNLSKQILESIKGYNLS